MFITFEGIDGSGKSTQAGLLVRRLQSEGYDCASFREPGGTVLSERVRDLLLDPSLAMHPWAELLLFSAARAQLVAEKIRPALESGQVVVCDRFFDSTTAYQGGGRGLEDLGWLRDFSRHVTFGLVPDRTYLIEVDPATALERRAAKAADRMEQSGPDFYERVIGAYRLLAESEPARFVSLDGGLPPDVLHERIWRDVQSMQARHPGTAGAGIGSSS